ncbi:MAG TPA: hypothetical protein VEF55_11260 [Candidatus Binatia bacterium]|nr:hypothetical protein [Candidatus Binatia bacterium]
MRGLCAAFAGLATALFAAPAAAQDPLTSAAAASELREMCREDAGRLWNIDLCGPLMVVDPSTRRVWTSDPDAAGLLQQAGAGWVGGLPAGVTVANTTTEWAGVRWIQVLAPLPAEEANRRVLLAHEAWHRAQAQLGLPAQASDCAHLEEERARVLMRLEFRALATAMRSSGRARRQAAQEALLFRAVRMSEFRAAAAQEDALDRNEGLAAYTGVRLGVTDNRDLYAARTLDRYDRNQALARSYAYASGPAYGLLLDDFRPNWRRELAGVAPARLLAETLGVGGWREADIRRAGARYGMTQIAAEERTRAEAHRARVAELRLRFDRGPRLELPLTNMQMEFDPNAVTPLEHLGNYYATLTLRDAWGELRATEGAMISTDYRRVVVSSPGRGAMSGPGWQLHLAPGYQLIGPDRAGIFRPVQIPADAPADAPAR